MKGDFLRSICFSSHASLRSVFWASFATLFCRCPSRPASTAWSCCWLPCWGLVQLDDVKEVGLFLTGIFPLLFVPAAAGVMELWAEMGSMLLPIVIAIIPVTVLVLVTSGHTTQALTRRKQSKKEAATNDTAAE